MDTALASPTTHDRAVATTRTRPRTILATDGSGVIRHVSPAAQTFLGHSSAELAGRSLGALLVAEELVTRAAELDLHAGDDLEAVFAPVRAGLPREQACWTVVRADLTRVRVRTTVTPVRDGNDDVMAFVVLLEDL